MSASPTGLPAEIDTAAHPFVRHLLREHPAVSRTISGLDEMLTDTLREHDWDFALAAYYLRGLAAFETHRQVVGAMTRPVQTVLDFASGFGRATRFIAAHHGSENVTASEIQEPALAFLSRTLGVRTLASSSEPGSFRAPVRYDAVTAHSFFSHQPARNFVPWLSALFAAVAPGGALVFSVHDESLIADRERDASGLTFREVSETDRLSPEEYGSTWVSPSFVESAVAEACPGTSVARWPRGLGNFQDVYVVSAEPLRAATFDQGPFGFFSISRLHGDELDLVGWAAHWNPQRTVVQVRVQLNRETVAQTSTFFSRPDVVGLTGAGHHLYSGWRCRFRIPSTCSRSTDVLSIVARSDRDVETILYIGTIDGAFLESCKAELKSCGRLEGVFPTDASEDAIDALLRGRPFEDRSKRQG